MLKTLKKSLNLVKKQKLHTKNAKKKTLKLQFLTKQ